MSASIIHFSTRQTHQDAGSFAALAIALANVRMACDRCEAIARRVESGEPLRYDLEFAEAMEQVMLKARRVIDAGAVTPSVCRPVCRW